MPEELEKVSWRVNKLERELALQERVFELEKKFNFIESENKRLWKFLKGQGND